MRRPAARIALTGAAVAACLAAGPAYADAIDGDWCKDGEKFSIQGPDIVTPAGTATQGDYDRHHFAYIVPTNEPEAGTEIYMTQLNEQMIRVMIGTPIEEGEIWRRCEFVS